MSDGIVFALYLLCVPVFFLIFRITKLAVPFSLACFWPITAPILLVVSAKEGMAVSLKQVAKRIRNDDGDVKKRTVRKSEKKVKVNEEKGKSKDDVIDIDDIDI
ncbi:MAG: hypothetical protein IBX72_15030 [Nitrospirae bacterium]|nr:hypothetical protein [Nitrospirota bacterium]